MSARTLIVNGPWAGGPQNCFVSCIDLSCYCARASTAPQYHDKLMQHGFEAVTIYSTSTSRLQASVVRKSITMYVTAESLIYLQLNKRSRRNGRRVHQASYETHSARTACILLCQWSNAKYFEKYDFSPSKVLYHPEVEVTTSPKTLSTPPKHVSIA